jgi:hypothetical protein
MRTWFSGFELSRFQEERVLGLSLRCYADPTGLFVIFGWGTINISSRWDFCGAAERDAGRLPVAKSYGVGASREACTQAFLNQKTILSRLSCE